MENIYKYFTAQKNIKGKDLQNIKGNKDLQNKYFEKWKIKENQERAYIIPNFKNIALKFS